MKRLQLAVLWSCLCCLIAAAPRLPAAEAPAAGNGTHPEPVSEVQIWLNTHCPELYATAAADFGWHLFKNGAWEPLPAKLPPRVVVLVHGLDEPGKLWRSLAPALAAQGLTACEFRYPNDQPVHPSAAFLMKSLADLHGTGVDSVIIVAHSMGGLVSRELLTSPTLDYAAWLKKDTVPRVQQLIMLGTPNHGSELAHVRFFVELRDQWVRFARGDGHVLSGFVDGTGEAAKDLVPDSPFLRELNARPVPAEVGFTIIAGIASPITKDSLDATLKGWDAETPDTAKAALKETAAALGDVVDGVGDGAVPLDSARLDGVTDFVTVSGTHLSMIRNVLAGSDRVPPALPLVLERIRKLWGLPELAPPAPSPAPTGNVPPPAAAP